MSSWPQSSSLSKDPHVQVMDSRERKRGRACALGFLALLPTFGSELLVEVAPGRQIHSSGVFLFPCSVQTAVINVFKGGGLQSNELYALNENIRYVAGQLGTLPSMGLNWGRELHLTIALGASP